MQGSISSMRAHSPFVAHARCTSRAASCRPALYLAHPQRRVACWAEAQRDEAPPAAPAPAPPAQEPTPAAPAPPSSGADGKPLALAKGQGTAIITGAVSIIFGVAYLALIYIMDSRGGQMLPPPPEAFGP